MSEILKRDQNFRTVAAGVDPSSTSDIYMFRVDPVTNYLLVDITVGSATSAVSSEIASRDGNYRPVCLGWDETNGVLQEILTDENGYLLCDLEII